jgi:DNA-binding MarR family transcriptional regulator
MPPMPGQDELVIKRFGFELPMLLLTAFRSLVDDLHAELAVSGHDQARPIDGFALQAIGPTGVTIGELGRRLGVSKQAAAKTARRLEEIGYATRSPHPVDGRAQVITRTSRGEEMLGLSAEIFGRLRHRWAGQIGDDRLDALEADLEAMTRSSSMAAIGDLPGWLQ